MEVKSFDNIGEKLYKETLENGLRAYVAIKPGYVHSYALFATNYGGADRRFKLSGKAADTPAGVAHFLEHKMFDTPDGKNALNVLSENGASPNAWTSQSMTAYHFSCTSGFEKNLNTLLEFVSVPYFTADGVAKEQGIITQEIRMIEDDPGFVVYTNLMKCLYSENPIRDSVAGTVESISGISEETLYECHKAFYNPANMTLCVAGDTDPEAVFDAARRLLPEKPQVVPESDYGAAEELLPATLRTSAVMPVSAPQYMIGAKVKAEENGNERLRQSLTGELALRCLMGRSSPFYTRLYAKGLINADFGYELDYAAKAATIIFGGESRDPEAVFSEFTDEVAGIIKNGPDAGLFERSKKALYGNMLRTTDRFSRLCSELAAGEFAGYNYLDSFNIQSGISLEDTAAFISDNLTPERLAMSAIDPAG
ncbi:MAG: insulinase family protein [Oscillospiraceae bacterium]|nr:insulinase family protein [Oscillospiraceae bacterium]